MDDARFGEDDLLEKDADLGELDEEDEEEEDDDDLALPEEDDEL